ncbi:MAG TPA: alpha/beta hydrolase, partial [Candidatus Nitrosotalea sp.]|nr:alpha/beta hydrolase [Candidatus Nitrosotalea sp.]
MKTTTAPLFVALVGAGVLLAAACSQSSGGGALTPATQTAAQSTERNGAWNVAYDRNGVIAAPATSWAMVPGILHASFSPSSQMRGAPAAGLRLTMSYPQARATEIQAARALVVSISYANNTRLQLPMAGEFDASRARVSVELPASLVKDATAITLAIGVDARSRFKEEAPGPRYWDAKGVVWKPNGTIEPGKKTVVLIHGIFSSVESSFPTPRPWQFWSACPTRIAAAGKFDQVLGFDYAWNEPPESRGKLFADFLQKVVDAKVSSVTIEAHSYGTLVALAAIPQVTPSAAAITNVVTMGGPLPLRGTPLAKPENHWRIAMMLGLLAWYYDVPPSFIDKAYDSGMVKSLATNSDALKTILSGVKGMSKKPRFVETAGTKWICFIPGIRDCNYSEETFKKVLVDGSGVELPWDGVVETQAANSSDIPDPIATSFPLSHIDLQCD